jgi:hypothetical protein
VGGLAWPDAAAARALLETLVGQVRTHSADAHALLLVALAQLRLDAKDVEECRKLLGEAQALLDTLPGVEPALHGSYYRVAANADKATASFVSYYKNALLYLACTPVAAMPPAEQTQRAHDLALAALLGESIYNFGDLVRAPVYTACVCLFLCVCVCVCVCVSVCVCVGGGEGGLSVCVCAYVSLSLSLSLYVSGCGGRVGMCIGARLMIRWGAAAGTRRGASAGRDRPCLAGRGAARLQPRRPRRLCATAAASARSGAHVAAPACLCLLLLAQCAYMGGRDGSRTWRRGSCF